jgi:hypothetical protein
MIDGGIDGLIEGSSSGIGHRRDVPGARARGQYIACAICGGFAGSAARIRSQQRAVRMAWRATGESPALPLDSSTPG